MDHTPFTFSDLLSGPLLGRGLAPALPLPDHLLLADHDHLHSITQHAPVPRHIQQGHQYDQHLQHLQQQQQYGFQVQDEDEDVKFLNDSDDDGGVIDLADSSSDEGDGGNEGDSDECHGQNRGQGGGQDDQGGQGQDQQVQAHRGAVGAVGVGLPPPLGAPGGYRVPICVKVEGPAAVGS